MTEKMEYIKEFTLKAYGYIGVGFLCFLTIALFVLSLFVPFVGAFILVCLYLHSKKENPYCDYVTFKIIDIVEIYFGISIIQTLFWGIAISSNFMGG